MLLIIISIASCSKRNDQQEITDPTKKYPVVIKFERFDTKITPLGARDIKLLGTTLDRNAIMQDGYSNFDIIIYDHENKVVEKQFLGYYYNFNDYKLELPKGQYTSFISISKPTYSSTGHRLQIDENNRIFFDYGHNQSKDILIGKSEFTVNESNNILQYSLYRPVGIISLDIEDLDKRSSAVMGINLKFKKPGSIRMDDYVINHSNMIDCFTEHIRFTSSGTQANIHNFYMPYLVSEEATIDGMQIELLKTTGSSVSTDVLKTFDVPPFKVYRNKQTTITGRLFDEDTPSQEIAFSFSVSEPAIVEIKVNF